MAVVPLLFKATLDSNQCDAKPNEQKHKDAKLLEKVFKEIANNIFRSTFRVEIKRMAQELQAAFVMQIWIP